MRLAQWTLGLVVCMSVLQPLAYGERGGGGHGRGRFREAIDSLDLTPEQRSKMRSAMETEREGMKEIREELRSAREALQDEVRREPFNESQIRAAAKRLAKVQEEMAVKRARMGVKLRENLTPEQKAKVKELHLNRREEGRHRREMGRDQRGKSGGEGRRGMPREDRGDEFGEDEGFRF